VGNGWVPISKNFRRQLPQNRPYTELEAAFSLQLDFDGKNLVSCAGYAKLWEWGIKKVKIFLKKMDVNIAYPIDTKSKQNQRGLLVKKGTDQGTDKAQIRLIDINKLKANRNRLRNRSGATTIDPIDPNNNIYSLKNDEDEEYLFDKWNSLGIIRHREFSKYKPSLAEKLKHYTRGEIEEAFCNLKAILDSDDHYYSHKWDLYKFLTQKNAFDKFLTVNNPFKNFKTKNFSDTSKENTNEDGYI